MTRQTSVSAYNDIIDSGWVKAQHKAIYQYMYTFGPRTSGECFYEMNAGNPTKALTQSRARFTELRGMGMLREVGKRKCAITGRVVILWDVTDNKPKKLKKGLTLQKKLALAVEALEAVVLIESIVGKEYKIVDDALLKIRGTK